MNWDNIISSVVESAGDVWSSYNTKNTQAPVTNYYTTQQEQTNYTPFIIGGFVLVILVVVLVVFRK